MKDLEFEHKPLNIDGKKQQAYARGTEVEQMRRIIVVVDDNGAFAALSKDEAKKKMETAQMREPM